MILVRLVGQTPVGGDARARAQENPMEMVFFAQLFEQAMRVGIERFGRGRVRRSAGFRPIFEFTHDVQLFDHHVDQLFTRFVRT